MSDSHNNIIQALKKNRIIWAPLNYLLASSRILCYQPYQYLASEYQELSTALVVGRDYSFDYKAQDIVVIMDKYMPDPFGDDDSRWLYQYMAHVKNKAKSIIYLYVPEEDHVVNVTNLPVDRIIVFNSYTEAYLNKIKINVPISKLFEPHNTNSYYQILNIKKTISPKIIIGFHGWEYPFPALSKVLYRIQNDFDVDYLFIVGENQTNNSFSDNITIKTVPWRLETFDFYMSQVDIGFRPVKPNFDHKSSWSPLEWLKFKKPVIVDGKMAEYKKDFPENWPMPMNEDEWYIEFVNLIKDETSRRELGDTGFIFLKENYSISEYLFKLFENILLSIK